MEGHVQCFKAMESHHRLPLDERELSYPSSRPPDSAPSSSTYNPSGTITLSEREFPSALGNDGEDLVSMTLEVAVDCGQFVILINREFLKLKARR
jgi:hypothetical protein